MALIVGAISDIDLVSREIEGKVVVSGIFQLQTKSPSEYWTIKVTPEHVSAGVIEQLKKYENAKDSWSSKPVHLNVRAKESSFNGQKFFNFFLDSIPSQDAIKG